MHSRPLSRLIAGLTILLAIRPAPVTGQELAEKEFPKANATLKDGIKSIRSIRKQRDGRVLVAGGDDQLPALASPRMPYPVVRSSLKTLRVHTIVQLMPAQSPCPPLSPASSNAGTLVVYIGTAPVQSVDVWAAYPDGTVPVVRAATYRMEWFSPDGSRASTEPVLYTPISVTSGDRKRVVEEFKRTADAALQSNPMRTAILAINYYEPASWPTSHPPFRGDIAPLIDMHVRLWLGTRCRKDEQSLCYDVIDRRGARVDRYKLPPRTVIVGFGKDAAYSFVDANDVLPRHPLAGLP